jgi:hypothetical protein
MQETCCGKISILRSAQKKISTLSGRFIKTALKGSLFLLYAQEPLGKAFSATAFPSYRFPVIDNCSFSDKLYESEEVKVARS